MGIDDQLLQANSAGSSGSDDSDNSDSGDVGEGSENFGDEQDSDEDGSDEDSASGAGNLRAGRRQGVTADDNGSETPGDDLRADKQQKKIDQKEQDDKDQKKEGGDDGALGSLSSQAPSPFNETLKDSWLNLIDSFGLTLLYINLHAFLHNILPKQFCALGEEWVPSGKGGGGGAQSKLVKKFKEKIGLPEIILLIFCDLIVLFILLFIACLIYVIYDFIANPVGFLFKLI